MFDYQSVGNSATRLIEDMVPKQYVKMTDRECRNRNDEGYYETNKGNICYNTLKDTNSMCGHLCNKYIYYRDIYA